MDHKKRNERLMALAVLLGVLLNIPLLAAANKKLLFHGIPVLFLYIAIVWLGGILLMYFAVERNKNGKR